MKSLDVVKSQVHQVFKGGNQVMQSLSGAKFYVIGLVTSVLLTLFAFYIVSYYTNPRHPSLPSLVIIPVLLILAVMQLITQLVFFIHLGQESPPKWNVVLFISTFAGILLIVVSSMWIMANLNYRMPR